ncbi:uncharacterized protein LOC134245105 [Saccostrea cucullata]|uniref:uncharacterized protein LOC134245105 n=1 Tax=Saccostrea cuccullata TaxID=36930 RepID=UPI002ED5B501
MGKGSLDFSTKTIHRDLINEFIDFMKSMGVNPQTSHNYLKSLNHLISYYVNASELYVEDREERKRLKAERNLIDEILKVGVSKDARVRYRLKILTAPPPLQPAQIAERVNILRATAVKEMDEIEKVKALKMDNIALLNRYIAFEICLRQGHRPGVVMNWKIQTYISALEKPQNNPVFRGEKMLVPVHEHKTADKYLARIVMDTFLQSFLEKYLRLVRGEIVRKTRTTSDNVLLQSKGEAFLKVGDGINDLQKKHGFKTTFITTSDARRSHESFNQANTSEQAKNISDFMCHSEDTRDRCYRFANCESACQALYDIYNPAQSLSNHATAGAGNAYREEGPREVSETATVGAEKEKGPTSQKVRRKDTTDKPGEEAVTRDKGTIESPSPSKRTSTREPGSIGKTRVKAALTRQYGDLADATIPKPSELSKYGIKKSNREKIARDLRYEVRIHEDAARYLLKREARAAKVDIKDLKTHVPRAYNVPENISRGKKLENDLLKRKMEGFWNIERSRPSPTDEDIVRLIETQEWPNIMVRNVEELGKGVFTMERDFERGDVVCDYHGDHISASEGEKRMKTYGDDPAGNYFLFYKNAEGSKKCCDASKLPCKCHPNLESTKGRLIDHSATNPNLNSKVRKLNGETVVLLVAQERIPPFTQLWHDYGVRKSESGEIIDWLNK